MRPTDTGSVGGSELVRGHPPATVEALPTVESNQGGPIGSQGTIVVADEAHLHPRNIRCLEDIGLEIDRDGSAALEIRVVEALSEVRVVIEETVLGPELFAQRRIVEGLERVEATPNQMFVEFARLA
jgi:hypothetical protein